MERPREKSSPAPMRVKMGDGRHLTDVGRFAGHVRSRDQHDLVGRAVEVRGVRHERLGVRQLLDDRMPPVLDLQRVRIVDLGTHIARCQGAVGERQEGVEFPDRPGRLLHGHRASRHLRDDRTEDLLLQRVGPLLRPHHLPFMLGKLRRGEPLAARHRLTALVFGRRLMHLRLRNLDVEAENGIAADLQRLDAGARNLAGLILGNPLMPLLGEVAQLIQFRAVAGRDEISLRQQNVRLLGDAMVDEINDCGLGRQTRLNVVQGRTIRAERLLQRCHGVAHAAEAGLQ